MSKLQIALAAATVWHKDQVRKYTGEPYIEHPKEVAQIVMSVPHTEAMVCAAYLHDVVEDCGATTDKLIDLVGAEVAVMVDWLTEYPSSGNRKTRKAAYADKLSNAPNVVKTIKLADIISNVPSIVQHDPDFAVVYLKEKQQLMQALVGGDETLYNRAMDVIRSGKMELKG